MTISVDMGSDRAGAPFLLDLEELLATRLLVQGNSGSGKSHLLRRLLEASAAWVQQVIIDPEGDFVTLAERFGHMVIEAADYSEAEIVNIAGRVRGQRVSVILNLEGLEVDAQLRCAATFLNRMFDAPREQWYPVLVVVDEAQLFAPSAAGEVGEDARRASLGAMTNLMCRGRKRGLAGVIATQRLAKLAKNVAAEASNFLMGRTFLDIDMLRAADLLGMERRQAEQIRDLERGQFLALGPALTKRPQLVRIGTVETGGRGSAPGLAPLPSLSEEERRKLLRDAVSDSAPEPLPPTPAPPPLAVDELLSRIDRVALQPPRPVAEAPEPDLLALADAADAVLGEIVNDPEAAGRPAASLYQDFAVRCRMRGVARPPLELAAFTRRLALARADLLDADKDPQWDAALAMADSLPHDMLGVFLLIASAARSGAPAPAEADMARAYSTQSLGRIRRLIEYMEREGTIATRTDLRGRRSIALPQLGWSTGPEADPADREIA